MITDYSIMLIHFTIWQMAKVCELFLVVKNVESVISMYELTDKWYSGCSPTPEPDLSGPPL